MERKRPRSNEITAHVESCQCALPHLYCWYYVACAALHVYKNCFMILSYTRRHYQRPKVIQIPAQPHSTANTQITLSSQISLIPLRKLCDRTTANMVFALGNDQAVSLDAYVRGAEG